MFQNGTQFFLLSPNFFLCRPMVVPYRDGHYRARRRTLGIEKLAIVLGQRRNTNAGGQLKTETETDRL